MKVTKDQAKGCVTNGSATEKHPGICSEKPSLCLKGLPRKSKPCSSTSILKKKVGENKYKKPQRGAGVEHSKKLRRSHSTEDTRYLNGFNFLSVYAIQKCVAMRPGKRFQNVKLVSLFHGCIHKSSPAALFPPTAIPGNSIVWARHNSEMPQPVPKLRFIKPWLLGKVIYVKPREGFHLSFVHDFAGNIESLEKYLTEWLHPPKSRGSESRNQVPSAAGFSRDTQKSWRSNILSEYSLNREKPRVLLPKWGVEKFKKNLIPEEVKKGKLGLSTHENGASFQDSNKIACSPWHFDYYVHYRGYNRRYDRWCSFCDLLPSFINPVNIQVDLRAISRNLISILNVLKHPSLHKAVETQPTSQGGNSGISTTADFMQNLSQQMSKISNLVIFVCLELAFLLLFSIEKKNLNVAEKMIDINDKDCSLIFLEWLLRLLQSPKETIHRIRSAIHLCKLWWICILLTYVELDILEIQARHYVETKRRKKGSTPHTASPQNSCDNYLCILPSKNVLKVLIGKEELSDNRVSEYITTLGSATCKDAAEQNIPVPSQAEFMMSELGPKEGPEQSFRQNAASSQVSASSLATGLNNIDTVKRQKKGKRTCTKRIRVSATENEKRSRGNSNAPTSFILDVAEDSFLPWCNKTFCAFNDAANSASQEPHTVTTHSESSCLHANDPASPSMHLYNLNSVVDEPARESNNSLFSTSRNCHEYRKLLLVLEDEKIVSLLSLVISQVIEKARGTDFKEDTQSPKSDISATITVNASGVVEYDTVFSDAEENEGLDKVSIEVHEAATLLRTIESVQINSTLVSAWYFSPFPVEFHPLKCLYLCGGCLKYFSKGIELLHHEFLCSRFLPPGNEIYRNEEFSFFEVDGEIEEEYCENLSLLAKLFLDHKTLQYNVAPFLFYILIKWEKQVSGSAATHSSNLWTNPSFHLVGYFSKEKLSATDNNLACILTFPQHQRKGYGKLFIHFSYCLSKIERKAGTPERPLSDLGRISYLQYWKFVVSDLLLRPLSCLPPCSCVFVDSIYLSNSIVDCPFLHKLKLYYSSRNQEESVLKFQSSFNLRYISTVDINTNQAKTNEERGLLFADLNPTLEDISHFTSMKHEDILSVIESIASVHLDPESDVKTFIFNNKSIWKIRLSCGTPPRAVLPKHFVWKPFKWDSSALNKPHNETLELISV